ncbi:MAG TPA: ABC transporter permease [Anaerolineae bacterium]|nr:ABC transporter permease [Anaerolineae bacterium]HQK15280.1 ABC transporter permease [Anaerolineae bacterium]
MSNKTLFKKRADRKTRRQIPEGQEEEFYRAGQWQLVWWKFRRHKLAQIAMVVLGILYFIAIFAEFVSPHDPLHRYKQYLAFPPTKIHIRDVQGNFHTPFIYGMKMGRDPVTFRPVYQEDTSIIYPIGFFVRGDPYKFWGLFTTDVHLFGTGPENMPLFVLGTDTIGRDVLSRIFYGGRISLSVGLVGIAISFILGLALGGISGFFGGVVDEAIQRSIEVITTLPTIPLWMALAAALPREWPPVRIYFATTLILSILGWTGLARTVRGRLLSMREEDFVLAARLDGESEWSIITRYMIPGFASYIIVSLTGALPGMILGETSLSFLGIGLNPPTISWGVMLQDAQDIMNVAHYPWILWPVPVVVLAVLMFNFAGDGLRDAADPYVS